MASYFVIIVFVVDQLSQGTIVAFQSTIGLLIFLDRKPQLDASQCSYQLCYSSYPTLLGSALLFMTSMLARCFAVLRYHNCMWFVVSNNVVVCVSSYHGDRLC